MTEIETQFYPAHGLACIPHRAQEKAGNSARHAEQLPALNQVVPKAVMPR
jgi:hypothetical protein